MDDKMLASATNGGITSHAPLNALVRISPSPPQLDRPHPFAQTLGRPALPPSASELPRFMQQADITYHSPSPAL
jgi:hypothetical protein